MSIGQPSKKLRLEQQVTASASSSGLISNRDDDNELWGEDLCVDDQLMHEIESQALSQYQVMSKPAPTQNDRYPPQRPTDYGELEQDLQMKRGEVANLRMEKNRMMKEFKNQLDAKDEIIRNLDKQLKGKQSELEFRIAEMKSQTCKTPKTYKALKFQQSASGSPFRERFQFAAGKSFIKDDKVFNFGGQLNSGEVLYKLVRRAFNVNEADFRLGIEKGNDFTWFLNCCLLKLCRFTSFDKCAADDLITLVISRCRQVLSSFLKEMSASDERVERKFAGDNAKIIVLSKTDKNRYRTNETHLLLTNAKWFSEERPAVAIRQTIATLAKLIQVEEALLIRKIVKPEQPCVNKILEHSECSILDMIELLNEIVVEISLQKKSNQYEGVFSSILYFCSTFCARFGFENVDNKHVIHMVNILKKIMFSLSGFVAVRYFVEFLNSSARLGLSNYLCHRSAADTFSENFTSYSFSQDTCVLQVLCAHLEMIDKSWYFVDTFAAWLVKMSTTSSRRISWMKNETNAKLCECLPTLEQTTVRIMLRCVEQIDSAELTLAEKLMLNSNIKRCFRIFKQFKWQDEKFRVHVANCSMEYEILLFRLLRFTDDHYAENNDEFISEEMNALRSSNKMTSHSTADIQKFIESVLKFSPMI